MKLDIFIEIETRDRHGQLKSYSRQRANSVLRAFIDCIFPHFEQATITSGAVDTTGTTRSISVNNTVLAATSAAGLTVNGIVVGTSTQIVTVSDNALIAPIAHGNGSGQLAYGAVLFVDPTTSGSTRSGKIQRSFTNNYSSSITVNEVALYVFETQTTWHFCIDRTLKTFTIVAGGTTRVTYTIGVTV